MRLEPPLTDDWKGRAAPFSKFIHVLVQDSGVVGSSCLVFSVLSKKSVPEDIPCYLFIHDVPSWGLSGR
jgi:hypothetical protein